MYGCYTFINLLVNIDMLHPSIFRTLFFYIFFNVQIKIWLCLQIIIIDISNSVK
jgi:hypothetical protein